MRVLLNLFLKFHRQHIRHKASSPAVPQCILSVSFFDFLLKGIRLYAHRHGTSEGKSPLYNRSALVTSITPFLQSDLYRYTHYSAVYR